MQNVSELFKDMISHYLDENDFTLSIQDKKGGFNAKIIDGGKELCSVSLSGSDMLLCKDEDTLKGIVKLYVNETIKKCKPNKGG